MTKLVLVGLGFPGVSLLLMAVAAADSLPPVSDLFLPLVVIFLLVLINGMFVAAEFAIIGVREKQLEELAANGHTTALKVLHVLESRPELDHYISTAQLGIIISSLGLAMYGIPTIGYFIDPYLINALALTSVAASSISYIVALSLLIYLHVVMGEMVPKALALADASTMALALSRPMQLAGVILRYPVVLLNSLGNFLLRIFRIPPITGHERLMAAEELELIVAESAEGGLIEDEEEEIIRNIFDFSERTVGQVMTPRRKVQALPVSCPLDEMLTIVTESRHSRFPVYDGDLDHIVGILHLKDLIRQTLRPTGPFDLRLILRETPEVPEDYEVDRMLAAFKHEKLHMAVVRDEFGGIAGIVTLEDLVEEVVGEVRDEFDQEWEPYIELAPGVLELSGDYLLDDLNDDVYLGDEEELPDVETVGGLIISLLGRPPIVGDAVVFQENIHLVVLDVDRLAVGRVRVEFPAPDMSSADPEARKSEEE
ncbi:MAG: hemolysin family protein [Chloroflexota bacterium]|jgi:CBS domain containing-hemolysin-like protein